MPVNTLLDRSHVLRLLAYHHWAGDQLFGAGTVLSAADLDAPWGGSFGTGRGLLAHVIGAERIWCDRWNGAQQATRPEYPPTHSGADFRGEWERVTDDQRRFARSMTAESLARPLTYRNLRGDMKSYAMSDIFVHLVNHGTYHRGQISQLLRDRGYKAPSTDFVLYTETEAGR